MLHVAWQSVLRAAQYSLLVHTLVREAERAANLLKSNMVSLTVGTLSAESVPAKLMSTASGLVVGLAKCWGAASLQPSLATWRSTSASSTSCISASSRSLLALL